MAASRTIRTRTIGLVGAPSSGRSGFGSSPASRTLLCARRRCRQRVGDVRDEQVHERDPAFDDCADLVALGRRRSAEDQRHPSVAEAGLDCRVLPGHDQGSVDRRRSNAALGDPAIADRIDQRVGRSDREPAGRAALSASLEAADQAPASGRDRHADADSVRHRLERVPAERGQELRRVPSHPVGRTQWVHARRRRTRPARRYRRGFGRLSSRRSQETLTSR